MCTITLAIMCFLVFSTKSAWANDSKADEDSDILDYVINPQQSRAVFDWFRKAISEDFFLSENCRLDGLNTETNTIRINVVCGERLIVFGIAHPAESGDDGMLIGNFTLKTDGDNSRNNAELERILEVLKKAPPQIEWSVAKQERQAQELQVIDEKKPGDEKESFVGESNCGIWAAAVMLILVLLLSLSFILLRRRNFLKNKVSTLNDEIASSVIGRKTHLLDGGGKLWRHSGPATSAVLILLVACLAWGVVSADRDFPIPEFFGPLVILMSFLFIFSALLPSRAVRINLLLCMLVIPCLLILSMELYFRYGDMGGTERLEMLEDSLLRYKYRSGAQINRLRPDSAEYLKVNADGLNDQAYSMAKEPGTFRIALLGDSVPNDGSLAFSELFHQKLKQGLNDRLASAPIGGFSSVEVMNISCEGYNTLQEVRLFEKVGLRYQPDMVLVAYVLNDPFPQNGAYRRIGNSFFLFRALTWFEYLLDKYLGIEFDMFEMYYRRHSYDLIVRNSFERLKLLGKMHGFPVLVAVLPVFHNFERHPYVKYYGDVAQTAQDQGFYSLVLYDSFKSQSVDLYSKQNDLTHPNAAGHEKMAEIIISFISETPEIFNRSLSE